jgi:chitodextrinase
MLAQVCTDYHPSDHDSGANDADAGPYTPAITAAIRQVAGQRSYPVTGTRAYSRVVGRVRMIFLDLRSSSRSLKAAADNSSKSMLGTAQKTWLKAELLQPEPLKVMFGDTVWVQTKDSGEDSWSSYDTERTEIGAFITANGLTKNVLYFAGDSHSIMADTGVNNSWGRFATAGGAALAGVGGSLKGGPWSQGGTASGSGQFGWVDVVDNGTTLTWTYRGYRADGTTAHSMTASIAAAADLVDPVDPDPIEVDPSPVGTDGVSKDIFITQAEVASLPRTGAAWDRVTAISNTAPGSGALNAAGNTHGATLLTTALRWRADGGGRGKDAVITGCLQALSTYTNPTTDIASPAKQLGAYLLALDVVGASQQLIVPGTGLTLGALLDRLPGYTFLNSVGAAGNTRWPTLIEAARDSGDQTGDYARFCLVAIGRIRGNQTWVEYGSKGYKRNLGDLSVVNDGAGTNPRFRALPYPIPGWRPPLNSFPSTNGAINPIDPDPNLSGANCVAASQGSATPPMTALGVDFTLDAWEALASTGILLVHAGYTDALTWGNSALRRNVASTTHHGGWVMEPATRGARRHLPYLANYLYGSSVPTVAQVGAQQGARMLPDVMPWLLSGSWMSSVAEGPNTPVVVSAPSVTLTAALTGTPLTVTTTASVAAGSAAISTVEFNWGDATATTVLTAAPYTAVHTFATSGPKTVTVRVTAGDGGTATATRTVNVPVAGSTAPTAALTATNATGRTPLTVTFNLAGSASGDGSTLTAEVDFGDNVILVGVPLSGTFTHTYTPETATSWPVTYVASARVTQANGESAIATAAVTVHSALAGADYYEMAGIMENGVLVPVRIAGVVQGGRGVDAIVATTPAGYAALAAPDPTTMYVAVDSGEFPPEGPVQVVDVSGPTAPTALAVTATTPTSASLTWAASTDPESGVSGYEVFRNGTLVTSTSTRTVTVTGLTASTAYTFTVRAYDVAGNRGAASSPLVVTTPASADTTAPTAPSGLTATSATTTSIALSWAAATDAVGVAGYEVFRGTTLVATTAPGTRTATATGLAPGTSYTFTVRAFDAAGNRGPASAALTTTTAAASDITAPTVAIQDPNAGVTVSGTRTVSGVVGDNIAVSQVAVRVNGVRVGLATVTGTTWTYQWVTTAHENGSVTLTAQATDTAGNATISAGRAVTIANTVTVTPTGDGSWDLGYTGVIPSGAVNFSGTTSAALKTAILALPAGGWLRISSPTITGDLLLSGTNIKQGITLVNAPGVRPTITNGLVDMSDGNNWRWWGINVTYPTIDPGAHMVKFDGGAWWDVAYSRFFNTKCYTIVRPGQGATNWRLHHCRLDGNAMANAANQDHALYVSGEVANQNGRIDHNLIENCPNGRGVKMGGASNGPAIGGVRIDRNTIHHCTGPSGVQMSNGATNNVVENNVVYSCGVPFTTGPGTISNNVHRNNAIDVAGESTAGFTHTGGNVIRTLAQLQDTAAMAAAGYGHGTA